MTGRVDMPSFSKQMSNDEFTRLAFLNDRIGDLGDVEEVLEIDQATAEAVQFQINAEIAELNAKLDALRKERDKYGAIISNSLKAKRQNKITLEKLERERIRLLSEIAARERFLAQRDLLFESTANKPWAVGVNGKKALPHQLEGAHRLVSAERALLADKPGLGKTLQAIMTIDMLRAEGKGQKVLIFTPKPVVADFKRAFDQWTDPTLVFDLNQTVGKGVKADILHTVIYMEQIIIITNYEVWRKDRSIHQRLIECGFDTIIMDEAHVLKDSKSKTTQDIRELVYAENKCPRCGHGHFVNRGPWDRLCASCEFVQEEDGDFCSVKNIFPMTGTPVLNKPGELWALLNLIDRKAFGSEKYFLQDYCTQETDYRTNKKYWTFGSGGAERLLQRLGSKYTGRTRESAGVVMPPQELKHHWLELDPEKYPKQTHFIEQLRDRARLAFSEDRVMTLTETLAWYTRMRQAASWPDAIQIKDCPHEPRCLVYD
ncbi:SNF2-related protein, partial [Streptomyces sp. NPDC048720]|uniref:SNF2-related protein n=1 Tax=Streptomyces sp. NPDC048720 TaxID=3365588 RepID=UPI003724B174